MTPHNIIFKSESWKDFVEKINVLPVKERGTAFEWFCKFFLLTIPKYKLIYRKVWHFSEFMRSGEHQRKLQLPEPEQGTDLIALRHDGKYEIIQCKYKNDINKNIVFSDINSSLTVATSKPTTNFVDTVLMCSNLKGITRNKNLYNHPKTILSIDGGVFENLSKEEFQNIKKEIKNKTTTYKKRRPLRHQQNAINKISKHLQKNDRGQIIHACGTGKTLTSYYSYLKLGSKITVFLVPSLQLINQTLNEWCLESLANNKPISPFVVCSDDSNEKLSEHDPHLWLQELGIKVSTDPFKIKEFMSSKRPRKVIFSTYKSSQILANVLKKNHIKVDLAFFDEAHNTVNKTTSGFMLDDKNCVIKKRLFMTATPRTVTGGSNRYVSMDDEEIYGEVIDEITVKDAIEKLGMLNDYEIITQIVDSEYLKQLLKNNPYVFEEDVLEDTELKILSGALALHEVVQKKKIKNIVSFHSSVAKAQLFKKSINSFQTETNIASFHVNGKESGTQRKRTLDEFASCSPSLVTNAQCLSEGVNVPSIDGIIFVDPKQSKVSITQAVGRALRKPRDSTKSKSLIIIPIVIDKNKPDEIDEKYQEILMVLRALAEHDGRIVDYFRLYKTGKKPKNGPVKIGKEFVPEEFDFDKFKKELMIKAWDRTAKLGRRPFEHARKHVRSLNLTSEMKWIDYWLKNPDVADIPKFPDRRYKEWVSWPDFLGKEIIPDARPFAEAKKAVQALGIKSRDHYQRIWRKNKDFSDMGFKPWNRYPNDWKGWSDFLNKDGSRNQRLDDFIVVFKKHCKNKFNHPYYPKESDEKLNSGHSLRQTFRMYQRAFTKGKLDKNIEKKLKKELGSNISFLHASEWEILKKLELYKKWRSKNKDKSKKIPPRGFIDEGLAIGEWVRRRNIEMRENRMKISKIWTKELSEQVYSELKKLGLPIGLKGSKIS